MKNPYLRVTQETDVEFRKVIGYDSKERKYELTRPNQHYDGIRDQNLWHNEGKDYTKRQLTNLTRSRSPFFVVIKGTEEEITNPSELEMIANQAALLRKE